MRVYKILTEPELTALRRDGVFPGSEADRASGFLHLSAGHQVAGTAAKHFAGRQGLWLAAIEAEALGDDLRWEPARGGAPFPHLYRPLRLADVAWLRPLRPEPDGRVRFAEEIGP